MRLKKQLDPATKPPMTIYVVKTKIPFTKVLIVKKTEDIISTIKTDKACGSNSIPTRILKDFKKELSKPLRDVIHISFSSGIDNFGVIDTNYEIPVRECLHENT